MKIIKVTIITWGILIISTAGYCAKKDQVKKSKDAGSEALMAIPSVIPEAENVPIAPETAVEPMENVPMAPEISIEPMNNIAEPEEAVGNTAGKMMEQAVTLPSHAEKSKSAFVGFKGTQPQSPINGSLNISEKDNGILVEGIFYNVPHEGEHGLHIHEFGSCEDEGNAAGGHFNPKRVKHGYLPQDGIDKAHAGDMGNIMINSGQGSFSVFMPGLSLSQMNDMNVAGKAVILHQKADDLSQPLGNAGGRIACGVILLSGN